MEPLLFIWLHKLPRFHQVNNIISYITDAINFTDDDGQLLGVSEGALQCLNASTL